MKLIKINNMLLKIQAKRNILNSTKKYIFIIKDKRYVNFLIHLCFNRINYSLSLLNFIIIISKKRSNTFIHLLDSLGNELFFHSINSISLNKKYNKETEVLQIYLKTILTTFNILKNKPLILHLININHNTNWFVDKLVQKLLIISINQFINFSFNGCRKKKI